MDQLERDRQQIRAKPAGHKPKVSASPDAFGLAAPFFTDEAVAGSLTFTIPRFRAEKLDVGSRRRC